MPNQTEERIVQGVLSTILIIVLLITAGIWQHNEDAQQEEVENESSEIESEEKATWSDVANALEDLTDSIDDTTDITLADIPAYSSEPYITINDNQPFFDVADLTTDAFESYSDLDYLGRCGVAYANICAKLMPTEEREDISSIKPTGWNNKKYDNVDGGWLYNRCHLIAFELAGENANERNLITGTRYFNVTGMLPFENMVADYVKETDNHVLYRVTPMYDGTNLVANGVLMEAFSVEDSGDGICFCIFCYNVQPGIVIDYATGDSYALESNE